VLGVFGCGVGQIKTGDVLITELVDGSIESQVIPVT